MGAAARTFGQAEAAHQGSGVLGQHTVGISWQHAEQTGKRALIAHIGLLVALCHDRERWTIQNSIPEWGKGRCMSKCSGWSE